MIITRLCDKPWHVRRLSEIYLAEWGEHYGSEWNISSIEAMMDDLRNNYLCETFVATDVETGELIGTVALLDEDLRTHSHLRPWISCLYVEHRYRSRGAAKKLINHVVALVDPGSKLYIWCYDPALKGAYERMGARCIESKSHTIVMELMSPVV